MYMSADLTKGSFGHLRILYVIKICKTTKFPISAYSYNKVKLLLSCNIINDANAYDQIK